MFSFSQSSFKINGKEVDENNFSSLLIDELKTLTLNSQQVTVVIEDPAKILDNTDKIILTKSSREREFLKVSSVVRRYISELADDYNAESTNETVLFTVDGDTVISAESSVPEETNEPEKQIKNRVVDVTDEYPEVSPNIPTLNNKQYNEFINLCNETVSFLEDYGEIGQKREWMLSKTDANNVAKVIFAPIRAWDYVGPECKMTKEDFELIKSNLVQISKDNSCAKLGEHSWGAVFERIKTLKTKWVKFNHTGSSFVAKIKTKVIDKKSKEPIGIIIVTLSVTVQPNAIIPNETKGFLQVLDSNISYNIIAR